MRLVLDAGALMGVERRDRRMGALLRRAQQERTPVHTTAPVLAQVVRDPARQANLARVVKGMHVAGFARDDVAAVGRLLAATGTHDVVDAHLVFLLRADDLVLTSDPHDVRVLADARGIRIRVDTV